jgi:FkbM family methyltransferase
MKVALAPSPKQNQLQVNYYDFGLFQGVETAWMIKNVFPALGIANYHIYGFEACKQYANRLKSDYYGNEHVTIINKAIVDKPGPVKLYYANNNVGHSVFATKKNVSTVYEEVEGIKFSEWIKENVKDYKEAFNIIKVNIEGAEWYLFNDLVDSGVHEAIDIYCGQGHDVEKITELEEKVSAYYELLKDNDIHMLRFTEYLPHKNDDIIEAIKTKMEKK